MKYRFILFLSSFLILVSCNKEEKHMLVRTESVLPGDWLIERVDLPGYGLGITYEGKTFYNDTVLFDIGEISISDFDISTLDLQVPDPAPVPCTLILNNEILQYQITHIDISGRTEVWCYFRSGWEGAINTPGSRFLLGSGILNNNYVVVIVDEDHIRLEKGNDRDGHVITLRRE